MDSIKNIFAPKSSRVLRVLLTDYGKDWDERQLAEEANVSNGLVHYVCKSLIELGSAARNEQNRILLTDPLKLLRRWASYHQYDYANRFLNYYTFEKEIDQFMRKVVDLDLKYALSSLAAAWLVAPYVRPVDLHIYVPSEDAAPEIAKRLEVNPIPKGGNVKFVVPYDEGVFYGAREFRRIKVVSNVQLYVDLFNFPARGEEAASQVLEVILKVWRRQKEVPQNV